MALPNNRDRGLHQYPDGQWGYDIRLGGQRVRVKVGEKPAARKAMEDARVDFRRQGRVESARRVPPLDELIERYLEEMLHDTPGSASQTQLYARKWTERCRRMAIEEMTPRLIKQFQMDRGKADAKAHTIDREVTFMRKLFGLLVRDRYLRHEENPFLLVKQLGGDNRRDRILEFAEEDRLRPELGAEWILPELALHTALRRENLFGLRREQVDLSRRTLRVFQKGRRSSKDRVHFVYLNDVALSLLEAQLASHASDFVFPARKRGGVRRAENPKGYLSADSWYAKHWRPACRRAQIENLIFHDLRRTCAVRLLESGVSLEELQQVLGHVHFETTQKRYAWVRQERLRDAMQKLVARPKTDAPQVVLDVPTMEKLDILLVPF